MLYDGVEIGEAAVTRNLGSALSGIAESFSCSARPERLSQAYLRAQSLICTA
jgi:hypothetical protein